ncbi:MAG: 8-amino-7-oxononanoate synthase [Steroidobacteraceae bacterium]
MSRADTRLAARLAAQATAGRSRQRRTVTARGPGGTHVTVDGRECVAFCSNDYLGLADHPRIVDAFCDGARHWGVGIGASHLVSGHDAEQNALEEELAEFVARPRALLFSTGYMANLAVASVLIGRGDHVLEDRLNHASLLDAGLASGARFARYAHGDVLALQKKLQRADPVAQTLVMTDGVFSMDGDVAPLREIASACRAADAQLLVDDAHGFGVLGATGAGSVEDAVLGLDDVPILMCTLGKAVGTFGAFVAGSTVLIESLLQQARTYIYTTALPPAVAAASRAALRVMRDEPARRERVLAHVARFRTGLATLGLAAIPSRTPIQPVVVGDSAAALATSDALLELGYWVPAIRPPTVPAGTARLRFTFSAAHTETQVDQLLDTLAALRRRGHFAMAQPA